MIQDETQKVTRTTRKQVAMIQDETQKDQKPEEVQFTFSPYLKSRTDKTEVQTKCRQNSEIHDEQS